MTLHRLEATGIRNLQPFALELAPGINLVFGANGSGKTSLLEAVHLLGLGRSFRTLRSRRLISDELSECVVFGRFDQGRQAGVRKTASGEAEIRIDGRSNVTMAELAQLLPLQLLHPESMALLDEGAKERRAYIDWGVFHVEHAFYPVWARYQRALKQRNSLLRSDKIARLDTWPWDEELGRMATALHGFRQAYLAALQPVLTEWLTAFLPGVAIELGYHPGWDVSQPLAEVLAASWDKDRERGHTLVGPHRADLRLKLGSAPADEVLSRGQKKMTVCALKLAQVALLRAQTGKHCTVLVDDLASELDPMARVRLCQGLEGLEAQVLVTCIEPASVCDAFQTAPTMFHVERGVIAEYRETP